MSFHEIDSLVIKETIYKNGIIGAKQVLSRSWVSQLADNHLRQ